MEQEALYKDQYDKSIEQKNAINNSLSTPIGIQTAFIAGLSYALTNFNFDFKQHLALSVIFSVLSFTTATLLMMSIYRLIRAYSDFKNGLGYAYLNDADVLSTYYQNLIQSYATSTGVISAANETLAKNDFDNYLLGELVRNAGINQRNNRDKNFERFRCQQLLIYTLISLILLIIPFGIDFGRNKGIDKVQQVNIKSGTLPIDLTLKFKDTTERLHIKPLANVKATHKANTAAVPAGKRRR